MSPFEVPEPHLQLTFYLRLIEIRETYLLDALLSVVAGLEIAQLDGELSQLVSNAALQRVAGWGLRGEIVFAVPYVLSASPELLGYYRLLLGFSQKQFYSARYGFAPFKPMEERGRVSRNNAAVLPDLCRALCASAELFVFGVQQLSQQSVHELTLLTLGPQLRGGALNVFGTRATRRVFDLISSIVETAVISSGIHLRRDSWVSVRYPEELNSATSSVTLQRTDRHGILGQKPADLQVSL